MKPGGKRMSKKKQYTIGEQRLVTDYYYYEASSQEEALKMHDECFGNQDGEVVNSEAYNTLGIVEIDEIDGDS